MDITNTRLLLQAACGIVHFGRQPLQTPPLTVAFVTLLGKKQIPRPGSTSDAHSAPAGHSDPHASGHATPQTRDPVQIAGTAAGRE